MKIRSRHKFKCDREHVWEKLMDVDLLGSIISDRRGIRKVGESRYRGNLPIEVGPYKGKVKTHFKLADINERKSFRLILKGKGLGLDFDGKSVFRLKEGEGCTNVSYSGNLHFHNAIPGFVQGEIHTRLKKSLKKLFRKIEVQCCAEVEHAH